MNTPPIFISYRRDDTGTEAGRLAQSLRVHFGEQVAFFDHESIASGTNWKADILNCIRNARVVLFLYGGEKWVGPKPFGLNRIKESDDMVRLEVETALENTDALKIPVVFRNAPIPPKEALPESLHDFHALLTEKNHFKPRLSKWEADLPELIREIEKYIPKAKPAPVSMEDPYLEGLPVRDPRLPAKPFKSLRWFTEKDARIFFGRGKDIRDMYNKLSSNSAQIIALYGQSGAGKSSLLHAGLLARLPEAWTAEYKRRTRDGSATEILHTYHTYLLNNKPARPLLILDQLEEIYTNPYSDQPDEAERLPKLLRTLTETDPNLRIILGFREEKWAAIQDLLENAGISVLPQYLKVLDDEGIRRAVAGVIEDRQMAEEKYSGLKFEPEEKDDLPAYIATDLWSREGSRNNAAPLLQFMLRQMWDEASADPSTTPLFSLDLYKRHRRESMAELLDQQLKDLEQEFPKQMAIGLVLELLRTLVTDEETAGDATEAALLDRYDHVKQCIVPLCRALKDRYLADSFVDKEGAKNWRLAHDALGKPVLQRFRDSTAPGQRARALLENLERNYNVLELIKNFRKSPLSEPDLEIIKDGKDGMYALNGPLTDIIGKCKAFWEDQKKQDEDQRMQIAQAYCRSAREAIHNLNYAEAFAHAVSAISKEINQDEIFNLLFEIVFVANECGDFELTNSGLRRLNEFSTAPVPLEQLNQSGAENELEFRNLVREHLKRLHDKWMVAIRRYYPDMLPVEGGTFMMGSADRGDAFPHKVTLDPFEMARTPVTWWQYYIYCRRTGRELPEAPGWGRLGSHPVVNVSWDDARQYVEWLNNGEFSLGKYRLPTEAEWEFAARGGNVEKDKNFLYSGGNDIDEVGWYYKNSENKTHPAGSDVMKPNGLDLCDMSGNVWEWCRDRYDKDYYKKSPPKNPQGPDTGTSRLLRGGSWYGYPDGCRVAYRYYGSPDNRDGYYGFRLARTL